MAIILNSFNKQTVRVIQLSDPHLGPSADYELAGVNTSDSLAAVLDRCAGMGDAIVASGDIAGHGEAAAYQLFEKQLSQLPIPCHWLPGNHDDLDQMSTTLKTPFNFEVRLGNWLLLMLNSSQADQVGGYIDEQQLLAACAAAKNHDGPVAVFMHHPLADVNCAWLDKQKVGNADEVLKQLALCGNVKAVFSGHVHQPTVTERCGIALYTAPSTCFQFAANSDEFAFGNEGPGFRWLDLHADGRIETGVVQLPALDELDKHCVGY